MTTSTVTIHEAESQLGNLVGLVQRTAEPLLLTEEENRPPVAFIASLRDILPDNPPTTDNILDSDLTYHIELLRVLVQLWLENLEGASPQLPIQSIVQLLHSRLRLLAQLYTEQVNTNQNNIRPDSTFNSIVMLLRLCIDEIKTDSQLQALDTGLAILLEADLSPHHLAQVDQLFLDHGIEAQADLTDSELVQSYIELL